MFVSDIYHIFLSIDFLFLFFSRKENELEYFSDAMSFVPSVISTEYPCIFCCFFFPNYPHGT